MKKLLVAGLALGSLAAQATTLFNNGPVVNAPSTVNAGLSVLATPATTIGFGAQTTSGNAVAEDFTVTGAGWSVESFTFYAYQTGATGFTFTDATWSVVLGDVNTGTVVASGTTAVTNGGLQGYRVTPTTLTATNRGIYAAVADIPDFALAAGSYWLRWSLTGTLASGPWQPPTSDAAVGNGQQLVSTAGSFAVLVDPGSLLQVSLPVTITGTVTAVPEASTTAMLLAGILAIGSVARRRKA